MNFTLVEGMLVGAIVSSTDAAAVFSILRTRNIGLKGNLRPLLEFESGSNDPMAYFLTISFIDLVMQPEMSMAMLIPKFLKGMLLGAACGYGGGKLMVFVVNRINLDVHTAGMNNSFLPPFLKGGVAIMMSAWNPDEALELIERHRVTCMVGVPAMFQGMARSPRWTGADLSSIRSRCAAAPRRPPH